MKKLLLYIVVLVLIGLSSCSKDENNASIKNTVVSSVSEGTWKISYFFDTDKEETSNFSGYNFTFGSNDVLSASNGTYTYTGSWTIMNSKSNGGSLDDVDFLISFATPADFAELSDDWEMISRTDSKIELKHVSRGNGGTDLLTFEKN